MCIVGSFPLPLALAFNCNVTIIDDTKLLEHYKEQLKDLYNINVVLKDPLFHNIQNDIDDKDLMVYYESEFQAPLEYYQHKHKDKDVVILNTSFLMNKHCKNVCYSPDELLEIYPMKTLYACSKIPFVNNHNTFYSYGVIDD